MPKPPTDLPPPPDDSPDAFDLVLHYPLHRSRLNPRFTETVACVLLALSLTLDKQAKASLRGLKGVARKKAAGASKNALKMIDGIHWVITRLSNTFDRRDFEDIQAEWSGAEELPHTQPNGLPKTPDDDGPRAA